MCRLLFLSGHSSPVRPNFGTVARSSVVNLCPYFRVLNLDASPELPENSIFAASKRLMVRSRKAQPRPISKHRPRSRIADGYCRS